VSFPSRFAAGIKNLHQEPLRSLAQQADTLSNKRGIMSHRQKYPKLDCSGFLERAFKLLNSGVDIELFYAALELRFTFEKVLIKHGGASTDYTNAFLQLHWQPRRLRNHLIREFTPLLDINKSYRFTLDSSTAAATLGYFLPVPEHLFASYGHLNDYLHAQWAIRIGTPDQAWYKDTHAFLYDFARVLVPHASPKNSLDYFSIPNIQAEEIDTQELEEILRKTLPLIEA
jgi:hypothetical protein